MSFYPPSSFGPEDVLAVEPWLAEVDEFGIWSGRIVQRCVDLQAGWQLDTPDDRRRFALVPIRLPPTPIGNYFTFTADLGVYPYTNMWGAGMRTRLGFLSRNGIVMARPEKNTVYMRIGDLWVRQLTDRPQGRGIDLRCASRNWLQNIWVADFADGVVIDGAQVHGGQSKGAVANALINVTPSCQKAGGRRGFWFTGVAEGVGRAEANTVIAGYSQAELFVDANDPTGVSELFEVAAVDFDQGQGNTVLGLSVSGGRVNVRYGDSNNSYIGGYSQLAAAVHVLFEKGSSNNVALIPGVTGRTQRVLNKGHSNLYKVDETSGYN